MKIQKISEINKPKIDPNQDNTITIIRFGYLHQVLYHRNKYLIDESSYLAKNTTTEGEKLLKKLGFNIKIIDAYKPNPQWVKVSELEEKINNKFWTKGIGWKFPNNIEDTLTIIKQAASEFKYNV